MTKRIKNLQTYPTIEHRESSSNIVTLNKLKTIPTIPTQSFQSPWTADLSTILPDLLFTHTAQLYVEQDVCTPAFLPFRKGRASSSFVPFPEHPSFHGPGGLPVPTAIFPLPLPPRPLLAKPFIVSAALSAVRWRLVVGRFETVSLTRVARRGCREPTRGRRFIPWPVSFNRGMNGERRGRGRKVAHRRRPRITEIGRGDESGRSPRFRWAVDWKSAEFWVMDAANGRWRV